MAKGLFEAHVTSERELAHHPSWKESWIDGDPVLGTGKRYYLTAYFSSLEDALEAYRNSYRVFGWEGAVTRYKVEKIVFDTKRGHKIT